MKQKFLNYATSLVQREHPEYDKIKIEEVRYGLEGFYLTITKSIVIFTLAWILNVFVEMIFMLIIFNILRKTGFGLHASKSWICLVSSSSLFLILPFVAKIIVIPNLIQIILGILAVYLIYQYAPADTIKRPLIYADRRKKYKYITMCNCIGLVFIAFILPNQTYSNLIFFGIYVEIFMILPIIYKIFHLSYNNYKNYKPTLNQG